MNVAAVTMGYNEPDFLPIWARHYSTQVGARNCFFVDHGSNDGSTSLPTDINIVRIPHSPFDPQRCARFMSQFCSSLLEWYDRVMYTDVDEMVVADPAYHPSLPEYCLSCRHDVVTAIGFNVVHTKDDPPLDPTANILKQRPWMYFLAAMCKPVLTRIPLAWTAGFHFADNVPTRFDDLYLFHLRFFDRDIGLHRLAKTRAMPWANPDDCWWQRVGDEECLQMFARYDGFPRSYVHVQKESPAVLEAISRAFGSSDGRAGEPNTWNLAYGVDELWPVPERFQAVF